MKSKLIYKNCRIVDNELSCLTLNNSTLYICGLPVHLEQKILLCLPPLINPNRRDYYKILPCRVMGWCARSPRIEIRGSHHIIAHPISRQIGF